MISYKKWLIHSTVTVAIENIEQQRLNKVKLTGSLITIIVYFLISFRITQNEQG
jgi:hypothetical protein